MNERERERKKEKRFSATTRGAERIERKKNSYHHHRKKTNLEVKKDVVEQTGAPFGFEKHLEGKTRADGNDERTTERSKQKERRWW